MKKTAYGQPLFLDIAGMWPYEGQKDPFSFIKKQSATTNVYSIVFAITSRTMKLKIFGVLILLAFLSACGDDENPVNNPTIPDDEVSLSIFFVNDPHGRIDNFSKIKHIVDEAKRSGNALLVVAGDIFAGNPIVDQASEPGAPMIDILNRTGFDVGVLGNHEFDFGTDVLQDRVQQSDFPWILANIDASQSVLAQPDPFVTLSVGGFDVTFLGLVETGGKDNQIPSTHPLRVADLSFQRYQNVIASYANLKTNEQADLYVALTHLGSQADRDLANSAPFLDLIIGGHSHDVNSEVVNGIPMVQAGSNLRQLGRIDLVISNQQIVSHSVTMIDLNGVSDRDEDLATVISNYNADDSFATVVGQSDANHQSL
ncbi:MAG: metallophosphatase, partial [Bacteroidota bacterium]